MSHQHPLDLRDELAERKGTPFSERLRDPDRYGVLLVLTLSTLVLTAALADGALRRTLAVASIGLTLLFALYTSRAPTRILRMAVVLVPLLVAGTTVTMATVEETRQIRIAASAILLGLTLAVLWAVLRRLMTHLVISWNTIMGAVCVYVLIGMAFSALFSTIGYFEHGPLFAQQPSFDASDTVYFSFVTLTTVGYGDLTMRADLPRMLAATEALVGQLYLVVTVALLVGNLGRERQRRGAPDASE